MDYLNKELVSIIVPVYNSSAYIENCVSGLLCQSYKNIEIILVDDGSSDDSLDKCRILSQLDTRICVYSKKIQVLVLLVIWVLNMLMVIGLYL